MKRFSALTIFFSLTIALGQIVTDDISYSVNVDTSQYSRGDTIHWSFKMVNISEDTIEFEDQGDGHFYNWILIDSAQTTGDGWVYVDCTTIYIIPPGDSLSDDFSYELHDYLFTYFPFGLYYGLMKPWYMYDSLGWDTVSFHIYEQLSTDHQPESIPIQYQLYQNYPNPFNLTTTIQYELPHRSDVQITIYDLLERKVTTLLSETQDAGYKSIQWDATNVSSGMYFYQIRVGEYEQTRKMVVLK